MIHKYQLNGYNIVLDVNSGAVHVVDELFYALLDFCGNGEAVPMHCPKEAVECLSNCWTHEEIE